MNRFPLGARGERPCFFPCPRDVVRSLTVIPGVARVPGGVATTYDVASVVARQLGVLAPTVPVEESLTTDELRAELGAFPGLARYRALELGAKLRGYQKDGAIFLARRAYALNADPMRCLSGQTVVYYMRASSCQKTTLEIFHKKFSGLSPGTRWRPDIKTEVRSMMPDGRIMWNVVEHVHSVGVKQALRVRTESGDLIDASEDHVFLTPRGDIRAKDLRVGQEIYTCFGLGRRHERATLTRVASVGLVGLREMYDLTMAAPHANYVANGFVVHNSGKSIQALTASVLVAAKRVLIVAPALAKYVWADEVAKWIGEETVILEGRAGTEARRYCLACEARGSRVEGGRRVPCAGCRKRNGQSSGYALIRGRAAVRQAIEAATYVVANYDLLVGQREADAAGALHTRGDLPGWAPELGRHRFDVLIADEAHALRGWSTNQARRGQTRRERFCEVSEPVERVWGLTGTPIYGFTRDFWGLFDALSRGAVTGNGVNDRLPFCFHARYCGGAKDEFGWRADGRSVYADTELVERLRVVKIQRPRSLILSEMPAKTRQVIRIDPPTKAQARGAKQTTQDATGAQAASAVTQDARPTTQDARPATQDARPATQDARPATRLGTRSVTGAQAESKFVTLMKKTLEVKTPVVVENIVTELAEGNRAVVFTLLRKNAEQIAKSLEVGITRADVRTRMREVDARIWCAHGDASPEQRFQMARAFREHSGAGVFVATIDAVQVAVSLKGATSVHFADLHWQPAALLQAEDRPYEVGTTGLSIIYYVVRGSIDEHVEATVLPKVITLARVVAEQGADELTRAFADKTEGQKTLTEVIAELMSKTDIDMSAFDDDSE